MLYINEDDPVFHHGLTNSLLNELTIAADDKDPSWTELQFVNFIDTYRIVVTKLQREWWDGSPSPPLFVAGNPKYAAASPELMEILSFDVSSGKDALPNAVWRTWFLRQAAWPVLRNAIVAYNNVLGARGKSGNLEIARTHLTFLVSWFQRFVRRGAGPHQQLRDLVSMYYPKHDVQHEYEKHLAYLRRFTILTATPKKIEQKQALDNLDNAETPDQANQNGAIGIGAVALLGVGAAALLLLR